MLRTPANVFTHWLLQAGLLACLAFAAASGAQAQAETADCACAREPASPYALTLALDADAAWVMGDELIDAGGGGALRIGVQRRFGLVTLIPELTVALHTFDTQTRKNATITAIKAGGRLRFLRVLAPGLFAHVGGGRVAGDAGYATTDFAFDFGLSLDYTALSPFEFGVHGLFERVYGGDAGGVSYGALGIHGALVL